MRAWFLVLVAGCFEHGRRPASLGGGCAGELYDACEVAADCSTGVCMPYAQLELAVCTQACDAEHPCPAQDGVDVRCNNAGLCRPERANTCTP
ncbi:MAG: hypothetical protein H0T46_26930 [Deltaproteobacteria bacterium]|nr:hypothetical protein [Deltaproteobacteria bacterium]